MGADTTSTQLIFFIAATVIATAATGVFGTVVTKLSHEVQEKGDALQTTLATEIDIINDPASVPTGPTRFYVKNVGSATIDEALTTILVDGEFISYTATLLGSATAWRSGDVTEFSVSNAQWTPTAGDHTLRVVTANGVWDDMRFQI